MYIVTYRTKLGDPAQVSFPTADFDALQTVTVAVGDKHQTMQMRRSNLTRWLKAGENIQVALPNLTASGREFLLTGLTDAEWDAITGGER